jgi:hypothetical protein
MATILAAGTPFPTRPKTNSEPTQPYREVFLSCGITRAILSTQRNETLLVSVGTVFRFGAGICDPIPKRVSASLFPKRSRTISFFPERFSIMAASRGSFRLIYCDGSEILFDTDGSDRPALEQFLATGLSLDRVIRVDCLYPTFYDVSELWLPLDLLLPWRVTYVYTRPATGRWKAESAGVSISAGSREALFSLVVQRKKDYPPNGH